MTKGKEHGPPGVSPLKVLHGKLLAPCMVFMLINPINSDLENVLFTNFSLISSTEKLFVFKRGKIDLFLYMNLLQNVMEGNKILLSSL